MVWVDTAGMDPGWYEQDDGRVRWWDGQVWTDVFADVAPVPPAQSGDAVPGMTMPGLPAASADPTVPPPRPVGVPSAPGAVVVTRASGILQLLIPLGMLVVFVLLIGRPAWDGFHSGEMSKRESLGFAAFAVVWVGFLLAMFVSGLRKVFRRR